MAASEMVAVGPVEAISSKRSGEAQPHSPGPRKLGAVIDRNQRKDSNAISPKENNRGRQRSSSKGRGLYVPGKDTGNLRYVGPHRHRSWSRPDMPLPPKRYFFGPVISIMTRLRHPRRRRSIVDAGDPRTPVPKQRGLRLYPETAPLPLCHRKRPSAGM